LKIEIFLMRLSLRARGAGSVGEMTQLISSAFDYVQKEIPVPKPGKRRSELGGPRRRSEASVQVLVCLDGEAGDDALQAASHFGS
jgi:hypothetical protein